MSLRSSSQPIESQRAGGEFVSELQRARICGAAVALVAAPPGGSSSGYARLSVERVVRQAGVSRRTFYECFASLEECFLAVFDGAVERIAGVMDRAYEGEGGEGDKSNWSERVRASLSALLDLLEQEPAIGRLVFVEALAAGPRVLAHRAQVLERLALSLEVQERSEMNLGVGDCEIKTSNGAEVRTPFPPSEPSPLSSELSPLTAEGIVNGVVGILHTRIVGQGRMPKQRPAVGESPPAADPPAADPPAAHRPAGHSLLELLNPLPAMVVLPYIGHAAATKELTRPVSPRHLAPSALTGEAARPTVPALDAAGGLNSAPAPADAAGSLDSSARPYRTATSALDGLGMRVTYRTLRVLTAIAGHEGEGSGPSNKQIADAAGIRDQGQISRLLGRLQELGLIEKTAGDRARGEANAWRLTAKGAKLQRAVGLQPRVYEA